MHAEQGLGCVAVAIVAAATLVPARACCFTQGKGSRYRVKVRDVMAWPPTMDLDVIIVIGKVCCSWAEGLGTVGPKSFCHGSVPTRVDHYAPSLYSCCTSPPLFNGF